MLSREEVGQRLESPRGKATRQWEREALQTAKALYAELDAKDAEIERLEQQAVRWEAMYEGMMAERDGLTEDVERLRGLLREWQQADGDTDNVTRIPRFVAVSRRTRAALEGRD